MRILEQRWESGERMNQGSTNPGSGGRGERNDGAYEGIWDVWFQDTRD